MRGVGSPARRSLVRRWRSARRASRGSGRDATVVVTFPNGFSRTLYFAHGAFISANPTISGAGTDTDWRIESPHHVIRVDDQRFELPGSLVFGEMAEEAASAGTALERRWPHRRIPARPLQISCPA